MKAKKARVKASEAMRDHYKELYETAVGEFRFELTQTAHLMGALDEIAELGDPLVKSFVKNTKEKIHLNKLAHTRKLFG